jgi:hypothetical protein
MSMCGAAVRIRMKNRSTEPGFPSELPLGSVPSNTPGVTSVAAADSGSSRPFWIPKCTVNGTGVTTSSSRWNRSGAAADHAAGDSNSMPGIQNRLCMKLPPAGMGELRQGWLEFGMPPTRPGQ